MIASVAGWTSGAYFTTSSWRSQGCCTALVVLKPWCSLNSLHFPHTWNPAQGKPASGPTVSSFSGYLADFIHDSEEILNFFTNIWDWISSLKHNENPGKKKKIHVLWSRKQPGQKKKKLTWLNTYVASLCCMALTVQKYGSTGIHTVRRLVGQCSKLRYLCFKHQQSPSDFVNSCFLSVLLDFLMYCTKPSPVIQQRNLILDCLFTSGFSSQCRSAEHPSAKHT